MACHLWPCALLCQSALRVTKMTDRVINYTADDVEK